MLQSVLQSERIDNRREHAHMVCRRAVHIHALTASPEIASADDNADVYAQIVHDFDLLNHFVYDMVVDACAGRARKGFAADFDDDSFIFSGHFYLRFF